MCGCQGGNKQITNATLPPGDYVTLEYVGHRGGINPFPGANGGYRFGTQRKTGLVLREDAEKLVKLAEGGKPIFVVVTMEDAPANPNPDDGQGEQPANPNPAIVTPAETPVVTPAPIVPKPATKPVVRPKTAAKKK